MTWTLPVVAAQLVLLAALVLYARHRVRKHYRYPSPRHPARRALRARGMSPGHPDTRFTLSDDDRHRLADIGMDSFVDVQEPDYQTTTGESS